MNFRVRSLSVKPALPLTKRHCVTLGTFTSTCTLTASSAKCRWRWICIS